MVIVSRALALFLLVCSLCLAQLASASTLWHSAYHRHAAWATYLNILQSQYPTLARYQPSIGKTVEQRDIGALRITAPGDSTQKKRAVFIGGQHARDWISIAAPLYAAEQLLQNYGSDPRAEIILDEYEFIFIPIANPDGYQYTWTTDRLWRKNRGYKQNNRAYGVDLDRNWSDHWGGIGSSSNPSSETFRGSSAASEPETKAMMLLIGSTPNLALVIDFQSYGQLILRPYGATFDTSPDDVKLTQASKQARRAIERVAGTQYTYKRIYDEGLSSGNMVDWVYETTPTARPGTPTRPYALQIILSPQTVGFGGFILPPAKIIPVGSEVYEALLELGTFCLANPLGVCRLGNPYCF